MNVLYDFVEICINKLVSVSLYNKEKNYWRKKNGERSRNHKF